MSVESEREAMLALREGMLCLRAIQERQEKSLNFHLKWFWAIITMNAVTIFILWGTP